MRSHGGPWERDTADSGVLFFCFLTWPIILLLSLRYCFCFHGWDMSDKLHWANIQVGGLQKTSLIDFPGKVSCVLFLQGCNFLCPYCHNPDLVPKTKGTSNLALDIVYDLLNQRRKFLDGVVISGGEPTLQNGLPVLCENIKNMGYAVKLDTNGSRPKMIKVLIQRGLVDYIAMDIKTEPALYKPFFSKTASPSHLMSSIRMIMESSPAYEFRTTCVRTLMNDHIIRNIGKMIEGAALYVLQGAQLSRVLNHGFFQNTTAAIDVEDLMHLKAVAEPWVKQCIVR